MSVPQRRPRRSREQWQRLVAEHAAGDLDRTSFCAQRGLSYFAFSRWKRKLDAEVSAGAAEPARPEFVELTRTASSGGWEVELELGAGLVLRLRRG